ncbi:primosomal protein N' [Parapedomonas caeni]
MSRARVSVLLTSAPHGPYDYAVPEGLTLAAGDVVRVPLGPRRVTGVVWDDAGDAARVADARLRPVAGKLASPPLDPPLRQLIDWTARYYLAATGAVLRMSLSVPEALEDEKTLRVYRPAPVPPDGLTPKRRQALDRLAGHQGSVRELAAASGVGDSMLRTLIGCGALVAVEVVLPPLPLPAPDHAPPHLSDGQAEVAAVLRAAVAEARFQPLLLEGVTGSGKTEVYFEAIAEALRDGGQALVLVPEIALTAPWLTRFAARFGCAPVVWHSELSQAERRRAWRALASGQARVVVGARSALFLPLPGLRVIIVDEEHETSFKQEDGVLYQARDVAVVRARYRDCPVVLASATPSLETRLNAESGKYRHLRLPARFGGASLPVIAAIDMRTSPPPRGRWLAEPLAGAVATTVARGEQALMFLNRRGYAPLTLCRTCGERITCPTCSAWLVEHRLTGRLHCHHCGFSTPLPTACPACGSEDSLVACGPGVERVAEEVVRLLPEARVAVVTSDTLSTPARVAALVADVEAGLVDVLVGTQIIAKGYHFPNLTLVGVVDADLGLAGGDLRAAERTFQQITQVAGRAGRADKPGRVLLQTYQPDAPVLRALVRHDIEGFYRAEAEARERHHMPPFGRLAALIVSGTDQPAVRAVAESLARSAPRAEGVSVLGPVPAPMALLRGRHRMRLLLRAPRGVAVQPLLRRWLAAVARPASVRLGVDVDPYSFM